MLLLYSKYRYLHKRNSGVSNKKLPQLKSWGFTIVELLVVIVVIAVLAAITFVVYNGVQQRARIARMNVASVQLSKQLVIYQQENGVYPQPSSGNVSCIGDSASLRATDIFPAGVCQLIYKNGALQSTIRALPGFEDLLKAETYTANLPNVADVEFHQQLVFSGVTYDFHQRGMYYDWSPPSGGYPRGRASIVYFLQGDVNCGGGVQTVYSSTNKRTQCTIGLT